MVKNKKRLLMASIFLSNFFVLMGSFQENRAQADQQEAVTLQNCKFRKDAQRQTEDLHKIDNQEPVKVLYPGRVDINPDQMFASRRGDENSDEK